MGKVPYPDSETDASSSAEIPKKKKKFSILKYTKRNVKKKCKAHSLPVMEEPEYPARTKKLRGILKHDTTKEFSASEEDLSDVDIPLPSVYPVGKCLVGRVPRPPGGRPGHGGGVAIIVRKNTRMQGQTLRPQTSISGAKARESMLKRLGQNRSY